MCQNKRYFIPCPWIIIKWNNTTGKAKEQDDDEWIDKIRREAWEEFLQEQAKEQEKVQNSLETQKSDNAQDQCHE